MLRLIKYGLILIWIAILLTPGAIYLSNRTITGLTQAETIFPLFGLTAFSLIWSQIMFGAFMRPLEKLYPKIFPFHIVQGLLALLFALLHPLFLLISLSPQALRHFFQFQFDFVTKTQVIYVYFGELALCLLVTGLAAGLLRHWPPIQRYWHWIHLVHYGVFFLIFFHSRNLGTDVATSPILNGLWWFFFVTVSIGIIYRRWYIPSQEGLIKATS